jgi:hypothetical protein
MTTAIPTIKQVDSATSIVAAASILNKKIFLSEDALETECRRLERCIEAFYVSDRHDMQFLEFASNFLIKNYKELVFGAQFSGLYLSEVQDVTKESKDFTEYSVMA